MGRGVWECDQVPASKSKVSTQIRRCPVFGAVFYFARVSVCPRFFMCSISTSRTAQAAKRRGLVSALLLVPLHPLIYCIDDILIHALASGGSSSLDFILFPLCHSNRNTVKVCCVPFPIISLFASVYFGAFLSSSMCSSSLGVP